MGMAMAISNENEIENPIEKIKNFIQKNLEVLFDIKNDLIKTKVVCFLSLYIDFVYDSGNEKYKNCVDYIVNEMLLGNLKKNEGLAFVVKILFFKFSKIFLFSYFLIFFYFLPFSLRNVCIIYLIWKLRIFKIILRILINLNFWKII